MNISKLYHLNIEDKITKELEYKNTGWIIKEY